jgi:NAD(P)-dependent dehydrogenase (short-subunit alcohol dehydrogenase family)
MPLCRRVLPGMMQRRAGVIVNVTSVAGLKSGAAGAAHTLSKHTLISLTRSIACTYPDRGIGYNMVCPAGVETNIGTTAAPAAQWGHERLGKLLAVAKMHGPADEIAALLS